MSKTQKKRVSTKSYLNQSLVSILTVLSCVYSTNSRYFDTVRRPNIESIPNTLACNKDNSFIITLIISYEIKLEFPKLSQAELSQLPAESSQGGAFQFSSWNQAKNQKWESQIWMHYWRIS